jgi:hypothetical protein
MPAGYFGSTTITGGDSAHTLKFYVLAGLQYGNKAVKRIALLAYRV